MIDPRTAVIEKRLSGIKKILVFASGKGGVGKSLCSAVSALILAKKGFRTGLLDLDLQGASAHIILDTDLSFPEEAHGILPLKAPFDLNFMSIASFTGDEPVPLRGSDVSNAIIELLTVTIWGELDFLIVDMPPGIGDEALDLVRFMRRSESIIISSPSCVSAGVVKRLLSLFLELNMPILGVVENMSNNWNESSIMSSMSSISSMSSVSGNHVKKMCKESAVPLLGSIPFSPALESELGFPARLIAGNFGKSLAGVLSPLFSR